MKTGVFATLFTTANLLDATSTVGLLERGASEINPAAAVFGLWGLFLMKAIVVLFTTGMHSVANREQRGALEMVAALVYGPLLAWHGVLWAALAVGLS